MFSCCATVLVLLADDATADTSGPAAGGVSSPSPSPQPPADPCSHCSTGMTPGSCFEFIIILWAARSFSSVCFYFSSGSVSPSLPFAHAAAVWRRELRSHPLSPPPPLSSPLLVLSPPSTPSLAGGVTPFSQVAGRQAGRRVSMKVTPQSVYSSNPTEIVRFWRSGRIL